VLPTNGKIVLKPSVTIRFSEQSCVQQSIVPVAVEVEVGSCSLAENFSSQVVTIANKYLWYRQPTYAHHRSQVSVLVGGTCLGV